MLIMLLTGMAQATLANIHLNDGTNGTPGITDPAGNTVAPITDWHQINPSIPAGTNIVPIARSSARVPAML